MASRLPSPFFCLFGGPGLRRPPPWHASRKAEGQEARTRYGRDYRGDTYRLHLLDRTDPEQAEARAQRARREIREAQPASAQPLVGRGQHRATLVEHVKSRRELVEVVAEPVRLERFADRAHDLREPQKLEGERPLGRLLEHDRRVA